MKIIDTHAHLNFNAYREDSDRVVERSLEGGVSVINVGSQYSTSFRAVELAERHREGVWAAVGLHPIHLETGLVKIKIDPEEIQIQSRQEQFDREKYRELAKSSDKVVAIGEIGLDYYYKPKTRRKLELFKEKQKKAFLEQQGLAKDLNLPMIFHCRFAHDDFLELVDPSLPGVVHCFTGNWEQAKLYLEKGFYLGFNGLIFKLDCDEIIKRVPLERILIETDCPYLTPPPETGRNEPLFVKRVAEKIAKLKDMSYKEIAEITSENAQKLFKL